MRLATVLDLTTNDAQPVFELPGGERVPLRELFRSGADDLDRLPIYFSDLTAAVQYLDDVLDAARDWARKRADLTGDARALPARLAKFLPPISQPRSFRDFDSFEAHARAVRQNLGFDFPAAWFDAPSFDFLSPCSLIGHEAPVFAPAESVQLDFELEVGLVIGRAGRDIPAADAWKHVAGFTIINNFVARDIQAAELSIGLGCGGKAKDFATAVGPYLVTFDQMRDRIDDADRLHLNMAARINGKEISRGNAAAMHFTWPRMIEHASRDADLCAGDLIGSGAIGGGCTLDIGPQRAGGWLEPGDVIELEIERLGVLRTPIIARPPKAALQGRV